MGRLPWRGIWNRSSTVVALGLTVLIAGAFQSPVRHIKPVKAPAQASQRAIQRIEQEVTPVYLPPATNAPEPLAQLPPVPVRPHEVFGFAPYWMLDSMSGVDLRSMTTVAYFGVDVNPDGSIAPSGAGWDGYQSQPLVDLITAAHQAGDRVVLTAKNFDMGQLHQLINDPNAPKTLASQLGALITQKQMDGANLDFEGTSGAVADRNAFSAFAAAVAKQLKQVNPKWQLTVDTYGGSATDPSNFMDVKALAASFDALFVMAYDMYASDHASPNASLGDDESALAAYTAEIPASKVILGLPYYGYDWQTADDKPFSPATGQPSAVTYGEMQSKHLTIYWDSADGVPWATYKSGGKWHEIYFDNPTSLSLKARAADQFGVSNVGIWALGFDGNDPTMLAAVHGVSSGATGAAGPGSPKPTPSPSPSPKPAPKPSPTGSGGGGGGGGGGLPPPPPPPQPCPSASPTLGGIIPTPVPGCTALSG
ncbi:MAG TPA: glycosyl hydrolase family 18 protein [Candidatus Dormibacteraeota bacterium]